MCVRRPSGAAGPQNRREWPCGARSRSSSCRIYLGARGEARQKCCRCQASPTRRLRRAFLHLSHSMSLTRLLDTTPRSLLTAAACSGLRPAPDCRLRGVCPHLSYSPTPPLLCRCVHDTRRLRPWIFFAASKSRAPPASVVLTDCRQRQPRGLARVQPLPAFAATARN